MSGPAREDDYWKYHPDEDPELEGGPMPTERKGAAYSIKHRKPAAVEEGQPPHHSKTIPSAIRTNAVGTRSLTNQHGTIYWNPKESK